MILQTNLKTYKNAKDYPKTTNFFKSCVCIKCGISIDSCCGSAGMFVQCWILNRGKTDKRVLFINADESDKMSEEEIKEELKKASAELFELMNEGRELEEKVKKILQSEIE